MSNKNCTYTFLDGQGQQRTIMGLSSMKAFLVDGGLDLFYPSGKFPWLATESAVGSVMGAASGQVAEQPAQQDQFTSLIAIAADSVESLRRQDVDRVITGAPTELKQQLAAHIKAKRPDLAGEVDDVMAEMQPPQATAAPKTEYPFGQVENGAEDRFFRSRVRVLPGMKGETAWEGEVGSVLNGGRLVEVKRDGQDFRVRIPGDRIEVLTRMDSRSAQVTPAEPEASKPVKGNARPDPGRYVQPKSDGSVAQQMAMSSRGGRTALLMQLNEAAGSPYSYDEVLYAADDRIDDMRDWLIEQARGQDTPKLTQAEAAKLMEWQSLGQKDGVKTHILTFYESQANKDAKRGRMTMATVTSGDRSSDKWSIDGDDQSFTYLAAAKKRGMEVGMAKAVKDGFVDGDSSAGGAEVNGRDAFTLQRMNDATGQMEPVTFKRGETIKIAAGQRPYQTGVITGISQAERKFKVDGLDLAHDFGYAYKADFDESARPKGEVDAELDKLEKRLNDGIAIQADGFIRTAKDVIERNSLGDYAKGRIAQLEKKASEVSGNALEKMRAETMEREAKEAKERTDAQAKVSEPKPAIDMTMDEWKAISKDFKGNIDGQRMVMRDGGMRPVNIVKPKAAAADQPASTTPATDAHVAIMDAVREGKATPEQFKAGFEAFVANKAAILAELDAKTKVQLLREGGPYVQMRYASEKKADVVDAIYRQMLGEYVLGESVTYGMGKDSYLNAVRQMVEATDADKLAGYVQERNAALGEAKARREAKAAAIDNPKTLDDFRNAVGAKMREGMSNKEAFLSLTPEQRIQYDTLAAETPAFSRAKPKASSLSAAEASSIVSAITSRWDNAPDVVVVADMQDAAVPLRVREYDAEQRSLGAQGEPEGFWFGGKVYLVAKSMGTPSDVMRVLFHEALGHYGLRGVFGNRLDAILQQIASLRRSEVEAKAKQYGLDMSIEAQRLQAAEEVLAVMAQTNPKLGFVKRAIGAIRSWLRRTMPGLFGQMELTDAEIIRDYILPARAFVERGAIGEAAGGAAFSRGMNQIIQAEMDPNTLVFREEDQNRIADVEQRFPEGEGYTPIVAISEPDGSNLILDGHNRAQVAKSRGDNLQVIMLTRQEYENLAALGYDDMEIAYAALARAGQWDAASDLANQFPGSGLSERGDAAYQDIPDIRFSRAMPAPSPQASAWAEPGMTRFDDFVYKSQDKLIDTKRVQAAITKTAGEIEDELNAYQREELYHGRAAKRAQDFLTQELNPMVERLAKDGIELADFEEYLHARHAPEANRVLAERNPNQAMIDAGLEAATLEIEQIELELAATTDPAEIKVLSRRMREAQAELSKWSSVQAYRGPEEDRLRLSGMSDDQARAIMDALTPEQRAKLDDAAAQFDAIVGQNRQLMVDYDLEDQETIDSWGQLFQHYVPLMREDEGNGVQQGMGTGQGFSIKGREVKSRTGSTRKVVDIVANVAMQRERIIARGEKNRVSQALMGLAALNPNPDFWKLGAPDRKRQYDPATNTVKVVTDPQYKNRENVVVAKVRNSKGRVTEVALTFEARDPRAVRMAAAIKNLEDGQLNWAMTQMAKVTRYLASINTQYNPIFGIVNVIRDLQGAAVNLAGTPLKDSKTRVIRNAIVAIGSIYRGARKERKGGENESDWGKLWQEFQEVGGMTGFRDQFRDSQERARAIERTMNPEKWMESAFGKIVTVGGALKMPMTWAQEGAGWVAGWLSDYNLAMENGVRLSAYKEALDKGMSREQAASLAKNLTVNFNRRGSRGMQMGAAYAFFNAAMQGTARMGQAFTTMEDGKLNTLRLSPLGKKALTGGLMMGVAQAVVLAAAGFGDDEPPEFVREKNLIIPTGWTGAGSEMGYVTIPMPLGLHVIPGLGRHMTEFAMSGGKDPAGRVISIFGMLLDAFNPIGNAGASLQTFFPTVFDPFIALAENKDFTGRNIALPRRDENTPGHQLAKDTASSISKFLSEAINFMTGGNEYVKGEFSPTPDQIDYLFGQVTGGVGREALKAEQTIRGAITGEEVPLHKIPLAGRFVGDSSGSSGQASIFRANLNRLDRAEKEIDGLREDGRIQESNDLRQRSDPYLLAQARAAESQVQRLRRMKRDMVDKGASRESVREVERKISEAMGRLNKAVESRAK